VVFFSVFFAAGLAGAGVEVDGVLDDELAAGSELEDFFDPEASALESVR
jgi:hypothetical protein